MSEGSHYYWGSPENPTDLFKTSYLVKLARDLTRVFTSKGSFLEGKFPYFREIQVGEIL